MDSATDPVPPLVLMTPAVAAVRAAASAAAPLLVLPTAVALDEDAGFPVRDDAAAAAAAVGRVRAEEHVTRVIEIGIKEHKHRNKPTVEPLHLVALPVLAIDLSPVVSNASDSAIRAEVKTYDARVRC